VGIVNLAARGMLVVSVARRLGSGGPLLAYCPAPLQPSGAAKRRPGSAKLTMPRDGIAFWLLASARSVPEDDKSGLHFCFSAPTRASVDAFHAAALEAGGGDNGKPGVRAEYDPDYYAAFVVDPDGYRLEASCGPG